MDVTAGAPLLTAASLRSSSLCRLPASPSCGSSVSSATSASANADGCAFSRNILRSLLSGIRTIFYRPLSHDRHPARGG
jgi:hypothetical protein